MSDPLTPAGVARRSQVTAVAFGPQGTLTEDDFAALHALGGRDLGGAVVSLVAQAALLPADIRESAEEAIGRAFTEGTADGSPISWTRPDSSMSTGGWSPTSTSTRSACSS